MPPTETDFTTRHTKPADLQVFRELRLEALKNHPSAFGSDYEETLLQPQSYWEKRLTFQAGEQALFFSEHRGQPMGMAGIVLNNSKKNHHSATIISVYVKPEWRGRRIAETLIHTCLGWAAEHGAVIVKLAVVADNLPAIRTYERCGFRIYGTEPKALYIDGIYYDEHLMAVEIPHPSK